LVMIHVSISVWADFPRGLGAGQERDKRKMDLCHCEGSQNMLLFSTDSSEWIVECERS
jgi:hypothetical protein